MDTITHGFAGALLGCGLFDAHEDWAVTAAATLGAVFPDVDVVFEGLSGDPMALLKYHRGITHSFLALPVFAGLLGAAVGALARRPDQPARPRWLLLSLSAAVGLASHIVLDGLTSFGTRMWDPLSFRRVAWDWLFIVDPLFTALVVLPLAWVWVYRRADRAWRRAWVCWLGFSTLAAAAWAAERAVGAQVRVGVLLGSWVALAAVLLGPALLKRGTVSAAKVYRVGLLASGLYILGCGIAHQVALGRVKAFAAGLATPVDDLAALPLPPSPWGWAGLVKTPEGVWIARMDVRRAATASFRLIRNDAWNRYVEQACLQPEVQTYLGFARFPVVRFYRAGDRRVVEFSDARFYIRQRGRRHPFTFRVVFQADGQLLQQGWVRD